MTLSMWFFLLSFYNMGGEVLLGSSMVGIVAGEAF